MGQGEQMTVTYSFDEARDRVIQRGSASADQIFGDVEGRIDYTPDDLIRGRGGPDFIDGRGGKNFLYGNNGADTFTFGVGVPDVIFGGLGNDQFNLRFDAFIDADTPHQIFGGDNADTLVTAQFKDRKVEFTDD